MFKAVVPSPPIDRGRMCVERAVVGERSQNVEILTFVDGLIVARFDRRRHVVHSDSQRVTGFTALVVDHRDRHGVATDISIDNGCPRGD